MKKLILSLFIATLCFGFVVEHNGKLYDLKSVTDEGFIVYDKLDADSNVVYLNAATHNYAKLGVDSAFVQSLIDGLPDSVLAEIPEQEGNDIAGWIAGVLAVLLGSGIYLRKK